MKASEARFYAFPTLVLLTFFVAAMGASKSKAEPITKAEVEAATKDWMTTFASLKSEADAAAFIDKFYAYGSVETMFKPTTAAASTSKADAVAYFAKQVALIGLAAGPPSSVIKSFITDPSGNAFAYGQWTMTMKMVPPPVKEKLDAMKIGLNPDGTSVTFDFTMGFTRVGGAVKVFLHHNVWTPTPQ